MGDVISAIGGSATDAGATSAQGASQAAAVVSAGSEAVKARKKQKTPTIPELPKAPPKPTSPLVSAARKALRRKTKSFSGRGSTILTGAGGLEDDGLVRRKTLLGA